MDWIVNSITFEILCGLLSLIRLFFVTDPTFPGNQVPMEFNKILAFNFWTIKSVSLWSLTCAKALLQKADLLAEGVDAI